ncbi:hypothetical protein [Pyrinomonas methylaliphatogenes]|jgi:hypothetical protein|uniref:hypothetical protein n=1 Tax=Pyrinomonas methylaliphatogenes TaxID=454194 RepID=UPI00138E5618|nr:hypothetical protein [Pyrinomonas methylaliphatogenes]
MSNTYSLGIILLLAIFSGGSITAQAASSETKLLFKSNVEAARFKGTGGKPSSRMIDLKGRTKSFSKEGNSAKTTSTRVNRACFCSPAQEAGD